MKKVKKDAPRQARRQRALDRFTIKPTNNADGYAERKRAEWESLHHSLGKPLLF